MVTIGWVGAVRVVVEVEGLAKQVHVRKAAPVPRLDPRRGKHHEHERRDEGQDGDGRDNFNKGIAAPTVRS